MDSQLSPKQHTVKRKSCIVGNRHSLSGHRWPDPTLSSGRDQLKGDLKQTLLESRINRDLRELDE